MRKEVPMNWLTRKKSRIFSGLSLLPVALTLVFLLAACGGNGTGGTAPSTAQAPSAGESSLSFADDVLPIFDSRCVQCHGAGRAESGLDLQSYSTLMTGSGNGPVVVAGNADASKLVELVVTQRMPKAGPKLTPQQIQILTDWVNQGALDN
jgi:mono/diheme cytochrome c family protein